MTQKQSKKGMNGPPPTSVLTSSGMALGTFSDAAPVSVPWSKPTYFNGKVGFPARRSGGPANSNTIFQFQDPNNQGQGWVSNPTVHDTVLLPETRMGLMNIPLERMLLLLNKNDEQNVSRYEEYKTYACFDPVTFNYIFAKYDEQFKGKLASEIFDDWTIGGVGVTDNDQKMKAFRGVHRGRKVVMAKQAYLKTFNYWGNQVKKNSKLYLIFKRTKIPYDTVFELGSDLATFRQLDRTMKPEDERDFRPFQIVPWAGFNPPPLSQTEYEDVDGTIQNAVWMQIGKSDDDLTLNSISTNEETPRYMHSLPHLMRRELVQILLDIGMPHCDDCRMTSCNE